MAPNPHPRVPQGSGHPPPAAWCRPGAGSSESQRPPPCSERQRLEKSVRRLREKFYGRVSVEEAVLLMRRYHNNHAMVCKVIVLCREQLGDADPEERRTLEHDPVVKKVVEKLKQEEEQQKQKPGLDCESDKDIEAIAQQLMVLPLTERNLRMFDHASRNLIPSAERQFACQACDSTWWRRVPERKQVSRCRLCGKRYDPVPYDKMWGTAEFHCPSCNRSFRGSAQMGMASPCFICGTRVLPSRILSPHQVAGSRSRNPHSCYAEDCYNRREPHVPGTHCVHPRSRAKNRLPKVLFASLEHQSTGSTVATCLSQGSLALCDLDELLLEDLAEESEGSED
ncbi:shiftless antiviral inhibitor of ribosomal frameshifting protein isoform X2 [Mauremys mutica]|uniref:shiftless antiviral inhibitor of ribosomal frameshifting protein isoform X2 n=1 Tax=Mauremys mutica TaxID=74926 RepID=UPI001D1601CF|nr:shiftless antiviral inhibitor of ribosomal frameshifting protein isoform X2 [Mauremys mutica]